LLLQGDKVDLSNKGYTVEKVIDFAKFINDFKGFVDANGNKTLGEFLIETSGKTEQEIEGLVEQTFVSGLTVSQAITKLENLINVLLKQNISLKNFVDMQQKYTGLTTAEIVNYLKIFIDKDEQADLYAQLTQPEQGQTLYDYIMSKVGGASVDSLIPLLFGDESEELTLESLALTINAVLFGEDNVTIKQMADTIVAMLGICEDYDSIKSCVFETAKISYGIKIDANGRLEGVYLDIDTNIYRTTGGNREIVDYLKAKVELNFTYGKPSGIEFNMPDLHRLDNTVR
jgi:hypothetical protein